MNLSVGVHTEYISNLKRCITEKVSGNISGHICIRILVGIVEQEISTMHNLLFFSTHGGYLTYINFPRTILLISFLLPSEVGLHKKK